MKYSLIILVTIFFSACENNSKQQSSNKKSISSLDTFKDSTSYALGADVEKILNGRMLRLIMICFSRTDRCT